MMRNEKLKSFDDIVRHLKLEDERFEAAKYSGQACVAEFNLCKALSLKHEKGKENVMASKKTKKHKRSKCCDKKVKTKMSYYNCGALGHFACDCTKLKKT